GSSATIVKDWGNQNNIFPDNNCLGGLYFDATSQRLYYSVCGTPGGDCTDYTTTGYPNLYAVTGSAGGAFPPPTGGTLAVTGPYGWTGNGTGTGRWKMANSG